jgi:hypothetical protein
MKKKSKNIYMLNEKNFLEEIFIEVQNVGRKDWDKIYTKSFDVQKLLDIQKHVPENYQISDKFNYEEWAESSSLLRYQFFAKKFQQMGIFTSVDIANLRGVFLIKFIPKTFIDFYGGRYGNKKQEENNLILLKINKENKTITRNSGRKNLVCAFRKVSGKNKRFEYVVNLVKSETKISGSKLSNTSAQNISTELEKINKKLKEDLDLIEDFIKNENNSGYEINKDCYKVEFV